MIHKDKIKKFNADVVMKESVYGVLFRSFTKKRQRSDVHMTAAERIAIDLLEEAWKDIETVGTHQDKDVKVRENPAI